MKRFLSLLIFLFILTTVKLGISADAGAPEGQPYTARVINPDGITYNDTVIPYGAEVRVSWEISDSDGILVIFEYGDLYGVSASAEDIEPISFDESQYVPDLQNMYTIAETNVYAFPSYSSKSVGKVPEGTAFVSDKKSGDYFRHINVNGIDGWVPDGNYSGVRSTVMFDLSYDTFVYIDAPICDALGNETGETLPAHTKIKVLGAQEKYGQKGDFFKVVSDGKIYYTKGFYIGFVPTTKVSYSLLVNKPDEVTVVCDCGTMEPASVNLEMDEVLTVYTEFRSVDLNVYSFEKEGATYYIFAATGDSSVFEFDEEYEDVVSLTAEHNLPAFYSYDGDETRGYIPKGTTFDVTINTYLLNFDNYERFYAKGYGWVSTYSLTLSEDSDNSGITVPVQKPVPVTETFPEISPSVSTDDSDIPVDTPKTLISTTLLICIGFSVILIAATIFAIIKLGKHSKNDSHN